MILAVNTSSVQFSIALLRENGTLLGEVSICAGPAGSRPLFPALDDLLARTGSNVKRIKALAVATGPGSFTGLRVGLSVTKGFSHALQVPLIGVPSLSAMAAQLSHPAHPVCPILGSKRGEVFAGMFELREEEEVVRVKADACLPWEELGQFVEGTAIFLGDDYATQAGNIKRILGKRALLAPASFWNLRASAVGMVALGRLKRSDWDDLGSLVPSYLRPPDIRTPVTGVAGGTSRSLRG